MANVYMPRLESLSVLQPEGNLVRGGNDQTLVVFVNRRDILAGESGPVELGELSVPEPDQAVEAPEPDAAVPALKQTIGVFARKAILHRVCGDGSLSDPSQPATRTKHVDAPIAGFKDAFSALGREMIADRDRLQIGVAEPVETAACPHPEASLAVLK
jgi:hypothetical protein